MIDIATNIIKSRETKMENSKKLIPRFKNEEEEAEYWDTHSPLEFESKPKLRKLKVAHVKDKPITIRLDSENRDKLNKLAAKYRQGPSTFARNVLVSVIEQQNKIARSVTYEQFIEMILSSLSENDIKDIVALGKDTMVAPDEEMKPSFLLMDSAQIKKAETLFTLIIKKCLGIQLITPETNNYEKIKEAIISKT